MNMKSKIGAAVLAVGLVTVPLVAQGPRGMHGGMRGGMMHGGMEGGFGSERMLEHVAVVLELTEAQKQFAKKLAADAKAQAQPLVEQLRQGREELAAAVKSNNTGNINNITTRQGNTMGQLAALHAKSMAAFYAQLTPEQKAKADAMREQMQSRRKEFGRKMMQGRRGAAAPQHQ